MSAQAARSGPHDDRRDAREFNQVNHRNRSVTRVSHVREKMQPRTQKRGTKLQRDFANGQHSKNYQQEDEAKIEAQFQLMVRPSTAAIWRTSRINCSNSAGRMDCGPSESARSGSW